MISEVEKYSECYRCPTYKLQGARLHKVTQDVHSLQPGQRYLDAGCGRGEMVKLAKSLGVEARGCELVPDLCDGVTVINGSLTALPFDDKSFDVVSCYDVIEHLPPEQVDTALDELFRVSRGVVILSTNDKRSHYKDMELHLTRMPRSWWDKKLGDRSESLERSSYGSNEWHWRCAVRP